MATYGDTLDFPAFFTPQSGFKVTDSLCSHAFVCLLLAL